MPRTGKTRDGWLNPSFSLGYVRSSCCASAVTAGCTCSSVRLLRQSPENGKAVSILSPVEVWKDERAQRNVDIGRHEAGHRPVVFWQNAEDEK